MLFLKIDFRFQETVFCCGDDHDYYMHAETIAIDFDLDYSNQLKGYETRRFNVNNNIAPTGFIGTGLLSAPFLFFGHGLDKLVTGNSELSSEILNFRILFYSLSSIFYLFLTINLTFKILKKLNYKFSEINVILIYFGSGVTYYAFERFSMTHVFECFCVVAIIYYSLKFYTNPKNKISAFLIPVFIALGISVRWVNYFYFLLPMITYLLVDEKSHVKSRLITNKYFITSSFVNLYLFFMHTKILYGKYTFNPQFVYRTGGQITNFVNRDNSILEFFSTNIINSIKILFSQEFGLFWFSPILFVGVCISLINFFITQKSKSINFMILFTFTTIFASVLLWRSTAASYGFRYLFCLVPLSIIIYHRLQNKYKIRSLHYYLLFFSIFSTGSLLFFETTLGTQLALVDTVNTFGRSLKYTQPLYLEGYLMSFTEINSYLKIFTTSFLGAIFFKLILIFIEKNSLISILGNFGLPVENEDFINYVYEVSDINIIKFIVVFIFINLLVSLTFKNSNYS